MVWNEGVVPCWVRGDNSYIIRTKSEREWINWHVSWQCPLQLVDLFQPYCAKIFVWTLGSLLLQHYLVWIHFHLYGGRAYCIDFGCSSFHRFEVSFKSMVSPLDLVAPQAGGIEVFNSECSQLTCDTLQRRPDLYEIYSILWQKERQVLVRVQFYLCFILFFVCHTNSWYMISCVWSNYASLSLAQ